MNILEFAIKMELAGEKYYNEQAEINEDNSLSKVFRMLAKDENMHAMILENKINKLAYELIKNETLSEAKSVFNNVEAITGGIKQIPDQLDAYKLALENEKESITLYRKCLSEATLDEPKMLFAYLLKQEEDHYAIIDQIISLIVRSEEWVESAEFGVREEY